MNAWPRPIVLTLALMGLVAACGGAATPAPATPAPATVAPATATPPASAPAAASAPTSTTPTATASPAPSASPSASAAPTTYKITTPATTVTASLNKPYDSSKAAFDPAKLNNLASGVITAQWFRGRGGTWIVFYVSLSTGYGDLCLGNSVNTGKFEHISNSPRGAGACAGDDRYLVAAPKGVTYCNTVFVFYVTDIPNAATGTLYASVERAQPDGSIVGITSTVAASQSAPLLDLGTLDCKKAGY